MKITIYTKPGCPACEELKNWLGEQGLEYSMIDLSKDPTKGTEMVKGTGQMIVPSVKIEKRDYDIWIAGFHPDGLKSYLK